MKAQGANPEQRERCGPAGNTTRSVPTELGSDEMILLAIEGCDQNNRRCMPEFTLSLHKTRRVLFSRFDDDSVYEQFHNVSF